jgi:hypothetical protein
MKLKAILLGLFISFAGISQAQTVEIEENEQTVNGVKRQGQQLSVQLDPKFVEKHWKDHLSSEAGKVKQSKGIMTVEGAVIGSISVKPMRLVSTVSSGAKGSYVWWSLDIGSDTFTDKENKAAKEFLSAFATKIYTADVLLQINKAEEVLHDTKKEQERVHKQADNIKNDIEKNKKRKQDLEAELVKNAEDLVQLEHNVELNKKQQEVNRLRVLEMEKALEAVRAKLQDIK